MTTIKLTIEKDSSWDCEGDFLNDVSFEWRTNGGIDNAEGIALSLAKALQVFGRIPVSAVSFRKAFLDEAPTRAEFDEERSKNGQERARTQGEFLTLLSEMNEKESFTTEELREIFPSWFGGSAFESNT